MRDAAPLTASIEAEYECLLCEVSALNCDAALATNRDKKNIVDLIAAQRELHPQMTPTQERHYMHQLMLDHLPLFLPGLHQGFCNHFECGEAKHCAAPGTVLYRPDACMTPVRATGDVYVCTVCGEGHHCTARHCPFIDTCPWSGIVRQQKFVSMYVRQGINGIGQKYDIQHEYQPNNQDGIDFTLSRILTHFVNRKQHKFPLQIDAKESSRIHNEVRRVVMDLLCDKVQTSRKVAEPRKKSRRGARVRQRSPQRSPIELYIRKCTSTGFIPNALHCIEEEMRNSTDTSGIDLDFKLCVINFINQLIVRIMSTGHVPHFNVARAALGMLYMMNCGSPVVIDGVTIIQPHPRIAEHLLPSNDLDARLKPHYDKSQVIAGKTLITGALRKLTSGNYNYVADDFMLPPLS